MDGDVLFTTTWEHCEESKGVEQRGGSCRGLPATGAVALQVATGLLALAQVALAADDSQFVLVGGGQVDGPR